VILLSVFVAGIVGCGDDDVADDDVVASVAIVNKQGVAGEILVGEEVELIAEAKNNEGADITYGSSDGGKFPVFRWSSSNTSVITVKVFQTGTPATNVAIVKGVSFGKATVTVEVDGVTDSVEVVVLKLRDLQVINNTYDWVNIHIDGEKVGTVESGKQETFSVSPKRHSLEAKNPTGNIKESLDFSDSDRVWVVGNLWLINYAGQDLSLRHNIPGFEDVRVKGEGFLRALTVFHLPLGKWTLIVVGFQYERKKTFEVHEGEKYVWNLR